MKMVDSSGWLEYFAGTPNAENFAPAIEKPAKLLVSVINMHEVFKKIARESSETAALKAVALMQQGKVQPVTTPISLNAARIGNQHKLRPADSLIYATALQYGATLLTQDIDFKGIDGVAYFAKSNS